MQRVQRKSQVLRYADFVARSKGSSRLPAHWQSNGLPGCQEKSRFELPCWQGTSMAAGIRLKREVVADRHRRVV